VFSQTAEYALRAVVVLAGEAEKPWTAQDIAVQSLVPSDYLMKVLQALAKAGLVTAQRGRGGGFILTRSPAQINVLDVITAVDPLRRIKHCPLGLKSHGTTLCPLHRKLDDAIRSVEEAFASTSIGDLLADPSPIRPLREGGALCHVQAAD
jgi:Rrf2 family transcriptional regulator, nitric oxide-sensitive transcriptional repressor